MRPHRVIVGALAVLAVAAAARSRPVPVVNADPSATLNVRTPVPAHVMSLLRRACFDCHSNETRWPWYAQLPIASQVVARDVNDGRAQLNWSQWTLYNPFVRAGLLDEVCELAAMGTMPPWQYRIVHADARLSKTEVDELCEWTEDEAARLVANAAQTPPGSHGWQIPESAATESNPEPINAAVLARGHSLYKAKCQRCHGADGQGRGPDADPDHPPGNLTDARVAVRNPDGVMFYKIWNGRAKPKMPAMKSDITRNDVWMVVQYVKTLRK